MCRLVGSPLQELHTCRACSLPFQEACLLWKAFVNDWSEVMAETRPGPDDALRLRVRFYMCLKCMLFQLPNPDSAPSCSQASACFHSACSAACRSSGRP